MEMVYLGLFSSVFKWVYNKILSPIVNFISDLLSTVLNYLFQKVLLPVLEFVLKDVLAWLKDLIMKILGELFYRIFAYLLKLIDFISKGYDIFIGNTEVSYYDSAAQARKTGSLLEAMFAMDGIGTAFRVITAMGIGIALMVAIYAIIKSTLDIDFENKRPVGAVLRALFKTMVQFLLVPLMVIMMIKIAGIVLFGLNTALSSGSNQTLGSMIFFIASLDASKIPSDNISHVTDMNYNFRQGVRGQFLENVSPYFYSDVKKVGEYFNYGDFDYLIGIVVSIFLIVILFICIISFIQRLFEVIVLYLTAPLFISTTPLDDGEKFGKWRDMFVAKCFTGYGSILAMKLYMIVCPVIIDNTIQFAGQGSSMEATYLLKLIFLVGGAWAFLKVGPMITTLLNYQAGMSENQAGGMVTGMMMSYAVNPAKGKMASMFSRRRGKESGNKDKSKDEKGAGGNSGSSKEGEGKSRQAFSLSKDRPPAPKMGLKKAIGSRIYHSDMVGDKGRKAIDTAGKIGSAISSPRQAIYDALGTKGQQTADKIAHGIDVATKPVYYARTNLINRLDASTEAKKAEHENRGNEQQGSAQQGSETRWTRGEITQPPKVSGVTMGSHRSAATGSSEVAGTSEGAGGNQGTK